ncbi:MAG TPA: diacylglycerol kinase family protein [Hyphomicrobiaceae bacterium]|nr:diacylglycerol kinase family protein [Hyphomicrobiaceae bacterium]
MRRRFFLVINAGAGMSRPRLVEDVTAALERGGASVARETLADFAAIRHSVREAACSQRYDAVIAAGGDGTIRAAAAAMTGADVPLAIIPCGTANVLAQEIGLKATPEVLCQMLADGPTLPIACAKANGEPFLLMAGAGFDARVVGALNHALKSRIGKIAYAAPVLSALLRPVDTLTVTIDNRAHVASWVVIANARHYAGRFVLAPRTGIEQRGLEAVLFHARSQVVLMGQLLSLLRGELDARARRCGDVEMYKCSHVQISAVHPVPVQIDGDLFGVTPLETEAGSDVIRLIVPAKALETRYHLG